jgi:mRNA interferase MazF
VNRVYPFQILLPAARVGLDRASKAQAEHVRSVDVQRLGTPIVRLDRGLLTELDDAVRLHLGL